MYSINEWVFDFYQMITFKQDDVRIFCNIIIEDGRVYISSDNPVRQKVNRVRDNNLRLKILRAYTDFTFEQQILSDKQS